MSDPFIAEIRIFAGNFAPRSWAFCSGQLLPIAQNTALFSLIGTTYGGDGRTTTALPDLRSRFPMHAGRGPGLSDRRLGARGGAASVTLSSLEIPAHRHPILASGDPATTGNPVPATSEDPEVAYAAPTANAYGDRTDPVRMASQTLGDTGGGQPHENRQPFLGLSFIICLQGVYPSRS